MDQQVNEISDQQIYAAYHLYENGAKLAEKEGDHEAAIALREQAKAKLLEAYQYIGNLNDQNNPAAGMSGPARVMAGARAEVGTGLDKIGNLVGLVPDSKIADDHAIDAPLMRTPGGVGGALLGQAAEALPIAGGASALVSRLGSLGAKLIANPIGRGAIEGAAQGLTMSDPGQRTAGTTVGALAGTALPIAGATASRIARGAQRTPDAQALMETMPPGTLTPGLMNPQGLAGHFEQMPGIRWLFEKARANAANEYGRSAAQRVSMPGTVIQPGDKASLVQQAYKSFEPYYNQARGFPASAKIVRTNGKDILLDDAFKAAAKLPGATPETQKAGGKWLQAQLKAKISAARASGKGLTSDDLIDLRSDIRAQRADYAQMDGPEAKSLRDIYDRANDQITSALHSQIPAKARQAVQAADAKYGAYKVLENAVRRGKDAITITPSKLSDAVASDTHAGAYARGADSTRRRVNGVEVPNTGLRDLAKQGASVFREEPGMRTGASNSPAAALIAAAHTAPLLTIPAGIGATMLGGTRTGRLLAQGATRPQLGLQRIMDRLNKPMKISPSGRDFQPDLSAIREDLGKLMGRYATASALQRQQLLGNE